MKTLRFLTLVACSVASAKAAYVYDFPSLLNPYSSSQWTANGVISASNNMVTSADGSSGGSLIFKTTVPGVSNSYEIRATLALPSSGGNYHFYLRATSNAIAGPNVGAGSAYFVDLGTPTFSGGSCTASLKITKMINGNKTILANINNGVPCRDGMVVRSVITQSNYIVAYLDNVQFLAVHDTSISSGQPGIGGDAQPGGNGISAAAIGHLDTVAPNAVTSISNSSFRDRVDLQWPAASDDSAGIGIVYYQVLRNNQQIGETAGTSFSDYTAGANNTFSYTVQPVDFHLNSAATTSNVTTPAAIIDPRETGIRPTGSYWGAAGEQIDTRSGNLNYTQPMVQGIGRGGWGVSFKLNYNSQNWRQDTAGTWQLGADTGFGYGWRLQAGSITPLYSSAWTLASYLFIDSTGAEYRLDQNTGGVWSSLESIYLSYDPSSGRLYFPDGSFWIFGSTSAGTEQDAGTMYPTQMEDSNGNQLS